MCPFFFDNSLYISSKVILTVFLKQVLTAQLVWEEKNLGGSWGRMAKKQTSHSLPAVSTAAEEQLFSPTVQLTDFCFSLNQMEIFC